MARVLGDPQTSTRIVIEFDSFADGVSYAINTLGCVIMAIDDVAFMVARLTNRKADWRVTVCKIEGSNKAVLIRELAPMD